MFLIYFKVKLLKSANLSLLSIVIGQFFSNGYCQAPLITRFQPDYAARYQYNFMPDTTQRNTYRNTELLLYFNNQESYCISSDRYYNDSLIIESFEKIENASSSQMAMNMAMRPIGMRPTSSNYLIRKERAKKIITYFTNVSVQEMYYIEQMDAVKWQLMDSTVTIHGFECKLAKKRYFGRNYFAFYAPSIAVQDGPLKFCGLPGLIIQIKDDMNEVDIILTELKSFTGQVRFSQNSNPIKTERKKLYDLLIQAYIDPFKIDEKLFNIQMNEEFKVEFRRKRQEEMNKVNNRLEKE
jgi:GLPGLI family protein